MGLIRNVKFSTSGMDGIKVFLSDFGYMESYRETELLNRFLALVKSSGVVADTYVEDKILPSDGALDNTIYISAGAAFAPNGGHIVLSSQHTLACTSGDVDSYIVARHVMIDTETRAHRETGVDYYMREIPDTDLANVFFLTTDAPGTHTDYVWLGKITGYAANKPVIDTTSINRELFSVFLGATHTFILWHYNFLNTMQTEFEDLMDTRYAQLVGLLDNKIFPDGLYAQTESATPLIPKNFRITGIVPVKNTLFDEIEMSINNVSAPVRRAGWRQGVAKVEMSWNWNDVVGTGGNNIFTVTSTKDENGDEYDFTLDELDGYYLYINNSGNYQIVGNAATSGGNTVLDVRDLTGGNVDLTGVNTTLADPGIIHNNAEDHIVRITPQDRSAVKSKHLEQIIFKPQTESVASAIQTASIELDIGTWHEFKVVSRKLGNMSPIATLLAGQFSMYASMHSYGSPLFVKLPNIPTDSTSLNLTAAEAGFTINIVGFANAHAFEICWSTSNEGADFENDLHEKKIIYGRSYTIATKQSREYNVVVRPLQSGQVVAEEVDWVSGDVVSGAGGRAPNEKLLPFINVSVFADLRAFTIISSDPDDGIIEAVVDPSWPTNKFIGRRVTDLDGREYDIVSNTNDRITITRLHDSEDVDDINITGDVHVGNSGPVTDPGLGTFAPVKIRSRKVYEHDFLNDVYITRMQFDCEVTNGTPSVPAIIRVYQKDRAFYGKSMEINATDTFFEQDIELSILGTYGNRRVIIDAWDPDNNGNQKRVKGVLTVFYRDLFSLREEAAVLST